MNDERDPLDRTLADGLSALAPSEFTLDADRTLGELRPRLRQARARHRLAVSTSVLGALVVVVGGAALLRHEPSGRVDVRGRSTPTVSTRVPATTTLHPTTTTIPRTTATVPRTAVTVPVTPPTRPTGATTTPRTAPPAAPRTETYSSAGGRVTIRFANGRLTLVSSSPAPGYTTEIHKQDPDDVEVRFDNGSREWRIHVRVENGLLGPEITEH